MLNFIPTDKNNEFGENDVWTGKLYEWDLNGDSLFVQEYEKGKLKDQYGLKPKISAAEKDLNLVVKNNSLQSLKGVKDKKVGSVWTWLGSAFNNVWQAINWLGYYLGIPGAWINDPYGTGIIIRTWDIHSVFGEPPSMDYYDDYAGTSVYVAAGTPIYNSYITPVGGPRIEYNPFQYDYPLRDDEIITLNDKVLTAVGLVYYDEPNLFQFYTETSQGVSMQEMLKSYLDTNGWTDENKEYAKGILRYLSDNRNAVDFEDFRSKLLNTYSDAEMLDIINTMQDPITGNGIELYLILNYRGSKLLNLSYNSSSNTIEVGSYTLRPHFNRSGSLLFYAVARLANGGSKNGIEYIIRADQLNAFRTNITYYTSAANWFYANGIPSPSMIKYIAGPSFSDKFDGLLSLWGESLKSPDYWAYLISCFVTEGNNPKVRAAIEDAIPAGAPYTRSTLEIGQRMHAEYKLVNIKPDLAIKEYRLPSGKRIDFLDIENATIYELKPNNPRQIAAGNKQLQEYLDEIKTMPRFNGINWKTVLDIY